MTAQVQDHFTYQGAKFSLVAMSPSEKKLFDPHDYGLDPMGFCTNCWDGYWCDFDISDALYLEKLTIFCPDFNYPDICGRKVSFPLPEGIDLNDKEVWKDVWKNHMDYKYYENMHLRISFTGKLLAGSDFLHAYYIHMGYQRAYTYEKLYEFEFVDGKLVNTTDLSDKAAELRKQINELGWEEFESRKDIFRFIDHSFSLDYGDKGILDN